MFITILCIFLLGVLIFLFVKYFHDSRISNTSSDKVCMTTDAYQKLVEKQSTCPVLPQSSCVAKQENKCPRAHQNEAVDERLVALRLPTTTQRDYRVLSDPLFPPLNRTEAPTHVALQQNIHNRQMYVPTNEVRDTYRLVGYLINKDGETTDAGGNNWKLMARMKDRHTADFYMIPSNRNYDIKVNITNDMVQGTRLRDLYSIPNEIQFKSPLLNASPYQFVEIEKGDLASTGDGVYI